MRATHYFVMFPKQDYTGQLFVAPSLDGRNIISGKILFTDTSSKPTPVKRETVEVVKNALRNYFPDNHLELGNMSNFTVERKLPDGSVKSLSMERRLVLVGRIEETISKKIVNGKDVDEVTSEVVIDGIFRAALRAPSIRDWTKYDDWKLPSLGDGILAEKMKDARIVSKAANATS